MPNAIQQSVVSLAYVRANITELVQGAPVDPTGDTVAFAFLPAGESPTSSTSFTAGSWDSGGPPYTAKCLVGPGGTIALPVGQYSIFLKVTDNPEIPVIQVPGVLMIF